MDEIMRLFSGVCSLIMLVTYINACVLNVACIGRKYNSSSYLQDELNLYKSLILNNQKLGKLRKKYLFVVIISILLMLILLYLSFRFGSTFVWLISSFVISMVIFIYGGIKYAQVSSIYKEEIINNILSNYYKNLNYYPQDGISYDDYKFANFENYSNFHGKDLIKGILNNMNFKFSLVTTSNYYSKGEDEIEYILFNGYVAIFEVSKKIEDYISVMRKNAYVVKGEKQITIDNEYFSKNYKILSNNGNLVTSIMSPNLINLILSLYEKTGIFTEFKWVSNRIYFRFRVYDLFNPVIFNIKKETYSIARSLAILNNIFEISTKILEELGVQSDNFNMY